MQEFVSDETEFQLAKARNKQLEEQDSSLSYLDPALRNIIRLLNQDDDIATIWSCEGHYDEGVEKGKRGAYIMFAVTEAGLMKLLKITNKLQNAHEEFFNVRLSFTKRLGINDKTCFKNRWILTVPYRNIWMKETVLKVLEKIIPKTLGHTS